jgi:hypothetical protein
LFDLILLKEDMIISLISLIGLLPENKKYNPKQNTARQYKTELAPK